MAHEIKNMAYWKAKSGVVSPVKDTNPHTGVNPPHTAENHQRSKRRDEARERNRKKRGYYKRKEGEQSTAGYTP